jgi:hypothetical protein
MLSTQSPQGDTDALVIQAIAAAGDSIAPCLHYASILDRAAAAFDLASAIRCAAPLLTEPERATLAGYLHPEGATR